MHRADHRAGEVGERVERRERVPDQVVDVHRVEVEEVERGDERLARDLVVHARHLIGGTGKEELVLDPPAVDVPVRAEHEARLDRIEHREVELVLERGEQRGDVLLGATGRVEPAVQDVQHVRPRRVAVVQRELERRERDRPRDRSTRSCVLFGRKNG